MFEKGIAFTTNLFVGISLRWKNWFLCHFGITHPYFFSHSLSDVCVRSCWREIRLLWLVKASSFKTVLFIHFSGASVSSDGSARFRPSKYPRRNARSVSSSNWRSEILVWERITTTLASDDTYNMERIFCLNILVFLLLRIYSIKLCVVNILLSAFPISIEHTLLCYMYVCDTIRTGECTQYIIQYTQFNGVCVWK